MMRRFEYLTIVLLLAAAAVYAVTPAGPRVILAVGQVTIKPTDSVAIVPVYLTMPLDSLAGMDVTVTMPKNDRLHFPVDEGRPDNLPFALDTSGTMISGWEMVAASSPSKDLYSIRVMGLADMPDAPRTLPARPQEKGLLAKLILRVDKVERLAAGDTLIPLGIIGERCTFADPKGQAVGIKTTVTQKCEQYQGDSCLTWKTVRVGTMDTTVVKFRSGGVQIKETASTKP
ncbi:MAG: hypothetical protein GYA46_05760 [candidate division Zixibacteria bacterium]|nr:hypothetical protein [candidate division Zixibacteria bacterium]